MTNQDYDKPIEVDGQKPFVPFVTLEMVDAAEKAFIRTNSFRHALADALAVMYKQARGGL